MNSLGRFEIVECDGGEYLAILQIRNVCASVTLEGGMYVPRISDDEYGDPCSAGQGLRTPELAAESALRLVQGLSLIHI